MIGYSMRSDPPTRGAQGRGQRLPLLGGAQGTQHTPERPSAPARGVGGFCLGFCLPGRGLRQHDAGCLMDTMARVQTAILVAGRTPSVPLLQPKPRVAVTPPCRTAMPPITVTPLLPHCNATRHCDPPMSHCNAIRHCDPPCRSAMPPIAVTSPCHSAMPPITVTPPCCSAMPPIPVTPPCHSAMPPVAAPCHRACPRRAAGAAEGLVSVGFCFRSEHPWAGCQRRGGQVGPTRLHLGGWGQG